MLLVVSSSLDTKADVFLQVKQLFKRLQQTGSVSPELCEEQVGVVWGVQLPDEGPDVLQENLQQISPNKTQTQRAPVIKQQPAKEHVNKLSAPLGCGHK